MSTAFIIKTDDPSDAATLLKLTKQLSQETKTVTIDPSWSKISVAQEQRQIELINHTLGNVIIIIKASHQAVGLVTVQQVKSGIGELGVAVEKKYWNLGLGTRLVQEAIRWFQTYSDLSTLFLTVENQNQAAVHVYKKCGFHFVKTIWLKGHSIMAQEMKINKKVIKKWILNHF